MANRQYYVYGILFFYIYTKSGSLCTSGGSYGVHLDTQQNSSIRKKSMLLGNFRNGLIRRDVDAKVHACSDWLPTYEILTMSLYSYENNTVCTRLVVS